MTSWVKRRPLDKKRSYLLFAKASLLQRHDVDTLYKVRWTYISVVSQGESIVYASWKQEGTIEFLCKTHTYMETNRERKDINDFLDKRVCVITDNLFFCSYVSGFVDGEGCFSISFRKVRRMRLGFEIRPSFSIGQKRTPKNYALLLRIRDLFKGGAIRSDSKRNGFYKYETRSLVHIRQSIIPFFTTYPLYTQKSEDFTNFCKICSLIAAKQHLNLDGLTQILDIAEEMNPSGTRRLQISEIRALLKKKL